MTTAPKKNRSPRNPGPMERPSPNCPDRDKPLGPDDPSADLWAQAETLQTVADALRLWDAGPDEDRELARHALGLVVKNVGLLRCLFDQPVQYPCRVGLWSKLNEMLLAMAKTGGADLGDYGFHAHEWGGVHFCGGECSIPGELDDWAAARRAAHHARERERALAAQPAGEDTSPDAAGEQPAPDPALSLSKKARAIAALQDHPDWSDAKIANAAGCNRTSLYAWPDFVKARAIVAAARADMPRGRKSADDGTMESRERDD